jgi:3-methyladenine DNA glycosylase AlkD
VPRSIKKLMNAAGVIYTEWRIYSTPGASDIAYADWATPYTLSRNPPMCDNFAQQPRADYQYEVYPVKAQHTTFDDVMAQLQSYGSDKARATYARMGAGENQFGVGLGKMREMAKKLKTNHALAMQLWDTGNTDAMTLACMIMDPAQLSAADLKRMVKPLAYVRLVDEFVSAVLIKSPHAEKLSDLWVDSKAEYIGRIGWSLMIHRILHDSTGAIDRDAVLAKIEAEILAAPLRKQETMNRCLVEIGVHFPEYMQKCIAIGERLGRFDTRPIPKGCYSSYAPEWIALALKRGKK